MCVCLHLNMLSWSSTESPWSLWFHRLFNWVLFLTCVCVLYFAYDLFPACPRRAYVTKNVCKSVCLCVLCVFAIPTVVFPAMGGTWHTSSIRMIAAAYVSHDFVGLLRVRLSWSTRLHHISSFVLMCVCFELDFSTSLLGQAIFVYTFCSSLAFVVNLYLAVRIIGWEYKLALCRVSLVVYSVCCACNWTWHLLYYDFKDPVYVVALIFIVWDDIYLLKFLWRDSY